MKPPIFIPMHIFIWVVLVYINLLPKNKQTKYWNHQYDIFLSSENHSGKLSNLRLVIGIPEIVTSSWSEMKVTPWALEWPEQCLCWWQYDGDCSLKVSVHLFSVYENALKMIFEVLYIPKILISWFHATFHLDFHFPNFLVHLEPKENNLL